MPTPSLITREPRRANLRRNGSAGDTTSAAQWARRAMRHAPARHAAKCASRHVTTGHVTTARAKTVVRGRDEDQRCGGGRLRRRHSGLHADCAPSAAAAAAKAESQERLELDALNVQAPVDVGRADDALASAAFAWDDPLRLDDLLTEDERAIRDTARAFCQERPDAAHPATRTATKRFDREILTEMGEPGLPRRDARQPWLRRRQLREPTA